MGQWDNLFAFRNAALRDDLDGMRAALARDASFLEIENPNRLNLSYLAKTYQMQTAAREGPIDRVRELAMEDPRLVRQPWTEQGWLPLSQAVWGNQIEIVKLLLEHGASGDDRVEGGGSVLQLAAELNRVEIARVLMEAGADPHAAAPDGSTPESSANSPEMRAVLARASFQTHG